MPHREAGKVGIYVDLENLVRNGGRGMRYSILREFAVRDGGEAIRMNVYLAFDAERAQNDPRYRSSALEFHSVLRDSGFKVIQKPVKWYQDEETGERFSKADPS
jgi:hypothetical protein